VPLARQVQQRIKMSPDASYSASIDLRSYVKIKKVGVGRGLFVSIFIKTARELTFKISKLQFIIFWGPRCAACICRRVAFINEPSQTLVLRSAAHELSQE
jgi:hypothetical protein